jgi:glycosyltransferase involved in cell wall biosynthesis
MSEKPIHVWAPAIGPGGGIQAFSAELAEALPQEKGRLFALGRTAWKLRHVSTNPFPLLRGSPLSFSLMIVAAAVRGRPCLIVSSHVNFGPVAYFLNRLLGIPYILVAHGIDIHPRLSRVRIKAIQNADLLIGVSQHSRERLLQLPGISNARIRILPNTVSDERFKIVSANKAILERYGVPPKRRIVLTIARLAAAEGYKGYDIILRGFRQVLSALPDAHYVICGKGDDRGRIEVLIAELGLQDCVTLTGFVPDEDLADLYRAADVFAMPSTGEGFGIVFLEAMACGIPVLAGNRDGSVDALAKGELGCLVDPLRVDEVAAGLISLLRKQGPEFWFQPEQLRSRMLARFGRNVFRTTLGSIISEVCPIAQCESISDSPSI